MCRFVFPDNIIENQNNLIRIGIIGRPHGVKGETRLWLDNPDSDTLFPGIVLHTKRGELEVKTIRYTAKFAIVTIPTINSREESQSLTNLEISVQRDMFPELEDDDTFYQIDLIGLKVHDTEKVFIGTISTFLDGLETDVVEVKTAKGKLLVPLIASVVVEMNPEVGLVVEPLSMWTAEEE